MRHCADTWFLLLLSDKDEKALNILRKSVSGKDHLIIPSIVLGEYTRNYLKKGKIIKKVESFVNGLKVKPKIEIVQTTNEITIEAGKISHTFGIPLIDSIIASTAKHMNCHDILSNDKHYEKFCKKEKVKLKRW